jgi:glycogen synthase
MDDVNFTCVQCSLQTTNIEEFIITCRHLCNYCLGDAIQTNAAKCPSCPNEIEDHDLYLYRLKLLLKKNCATCRHEFYSPSAVALIKNEEENIFVKKVRLKKCDFRSCICQLDNIINLAECTHNVCQKCFDDHLNQFAFSNINLTKKCPYCSAEIPPWQLDTLLPNHILNRIALGPVLDNQIESGFMNFILGKENIIKFIERNHIICESFFKNKENISSLSKKECQPCSIKSLANKIGPIVFTCPELGRFSTVGGLGVMVYELTQGLGELGEEVWVISPYYEKNKKGETGYLANDKAKIQWKVNISIQFGGQNYEIGLHRGYENGVNLIFLHNSELFPSVYANGNSEFVMKQIVGWAKCVLEALCWLKVIPSILVTNDWFTGLVPAYGKTKAFGRTFDKTKFLHIIHNLDPSYEGRISISPADNYFVKIHGLSRCMLVNLSWAQEIVNPSRCAIIMSDQWATVSPSYRDELSTSSPLKEILRDKSRPFAYPNGIPVNQRLQRLEGKGTHLDAKKVLQKKYFGFQDLDNTIPIFGFVGRITTQKGVHLILSAAETLIPFTGYKIQFLVGGSVIETEKYSVNCGIKMKYLRNKYPNNFFADPDNFFYEGPLLNLGSDFGLMPSLFEPGGIVQHEFFVAGTPVIAFKTGGLKDTVTDFTTDRFKGSGVTFEKYEVSEFIYAIQKALDLYHNEALYDIIRKNAFEATIDIDKVAIAWNKEFYRLKDKVFVERPKVIFTYKNSEHRLKSVQLIGSFDEWQVRHKLKYHSTKEHWYVILRLPKGRFLYKFIIDNKVWAHSFDHPFETNPSGFINNFIEVI